MQASGEGNGNLLQHSCLENPRGAWQAAVYGVAQSRTRLKQQHASFTCKGLVSCIHTAFFFFLALKGPSIGLSRENVHDT